MKEQLKLHKKFRNQLIIISLALLTIGARTGITEFISFGIIFSLVSLFNIYRYSRNKKEYIKTRAKNYMGLKKTVSK